MKDLSLDNGIFEKKKNEIEEALSYHVDLRNGVDAGNVQTHPHRNRTVCKQSTKQNSLQ